MTKEIRRNFPLVSVIHGKKPVNKNLHRTLPKNRFVDELEQTWKWMESRRRWWLRYVKWKDLAFFTNKKKRKSRISHVVGDEKKNAKSRENSARIKTGELTTPFKKNWKNCRSFRGRWLKDGFGFPRSPHCRCQSVPVGERALKRHHLVWWSPQVPDW